MLKSHRLLIFILVCFIPLVAQSRIRHQPTGIEYVEQAIIQHPGQSAAYILDKGEDSLMARAWLADNARYTIDIQYFIWSQDNVGILAMESMLRAAERGVQIRVIIDDITIDTPDKTLLALAKHPNIHIRIYNPKANVGVPMHARLWNTATDFRGINQRMHDKTFIVDGKVGITGGRNMADEYYDFNHTYNFRDRDVLLMGYVATSMEQSFERFWNSDLSVPVEQLFDGVGLMQKHVQVTDQEVQSVYQWLHGYAQTPSNFDPAVRQAISDLPQKFPFISADLIWGQMRFISDEPGKNEKQYDFNGGGRTTRELAYLLKEARHEVLIESPYLVMNDDTLALFKTLIDRGVRVRILTNSMASSDNPQAFSGYRKQRKALLAMGLEIYEFKPHPEKQKEIMQRYDYVKGNEPIFALHAKSMVVDSRVVFIGTFNLDPRSINLNTEVGVVSYNTELAEQLRTTILDDMAAQNAWNAATDNPDQYNAFSKRARIFFWGLFPIKPLL